MTVKLPDDKRDAFRQRVAAFRHSDVKSLKEVREVCGSLQHITMMARDLAPYLSEFYNFLAAWSAKSQYQKLYVPVPVQDEAKVWFKALQNEMIRTTRMPKNVFPLTLYVDASTEWGIGLTCEGKWAAWMLLAGWDTNGRGIGWAEAAALELGVRQAVELGASNCVLNIFSDNKGVIGAFKRGRSRGRSSNSIMRTLIAFQMEHQLDVRVEYVSTHVNPADAPSRGTMSPPTLHPCGGCGALLHLSDSDFSSSSGSGRSTDSARYHPYSINDSYIPSRPKHTTSATPTTLLSSGSPGSPVSKPIIKSKILAKDRMLALAPISGDQPVLRTTSGFNFDPHGCHWQAVKRILSTSL
ncbi:hypothetical protein A4X06_0g9742, partial [Tilletia controversa]